MNKNTYYTYEEAETIADKLLSYYNLSDIIEFSELDERDTLIQLMLVDLIDIPEHMVP